MTVDERQLLIITQQYRPILEWIKTTVRESTTQTAVRV